MCTVVQSFCISLLSGALFTIHLCDAMVDSHDGDAGDTEGDSHDAVMMTINLDVPSHLSSFCLFT